MSTRWGLLMGGVFSFSVTAAFASADPTAPSASTSAPPSDPSAAGKMTCNSSYVESQRLERAGTLRAARDELVACIRACPAALARDCSAWLDALQQAMPTVVFELRDALGHDVTNARVFVDGALVADRVDGRALEIDPGEHVVRYEVPERPRVAERFVARENQKGLVVATTLPLDVPRADSQPTAGSRTTAERPVPWYVFALGGLTLGAAATSAAFGIPAVAERDRCMGSTSCDAGWRGDVLGKYDVADATLGVSVVAAGAALILYLTRPEREVRAAARLIGTSN